MSEYRRRSLRVFSLAAYCLAHALLEATELWAKLLPNSRLLLIPEAGHMNWLDRPEAVVSAIGNFFQGKIEKNAKRLYKPAKSGK